MEPRPEQLAPHTTIKLGGQAEHFVVAETIEDIKEALQYAQTNGLPLWVLGGGSNTIFPDEGYTGVILKLAVRGITEKESGEAVLITAGAGEPWDDFVAYTIDKGYAGLECLSGIPGLVGATPIQNVGAYGQEVSEVIEHVRVIERDTGHEKIFKNEACHFGYRTSRFKTSDANRYIVVSVTYRLQKNGAPTMVYPELKKNITEALQHDPSLAEVREAVIGLRRKKSMVIDPNNPNSQSCGSFFVNPIITKQDFVAVQEKWKQTGNDPADIPHFEQHGAIKIPAAWLIEQAGFTKGSTHNGVAISEDHALALVNKEGTTKALLDFASEIETKVFETFGIQLVREPVVVS